MWRCTLDYQLKMTCAPKNWIFHFEAMNQGSLDFLNVSPGVQGIVIILVEVVATDVIGMSFSKSFIEIIQHNNLLQWSLSGFYDQSVLNSRPTLNHNLSSMSYVKLPKACRIYGFALRNCSLKEDHWNINNSFFTL